MRILLYAGTLLCCFTCFTQSNFPVAEIDPTLSQNANAVVRLEETSVAITAVNKMVVHKRKVITVFRKAGEAAVNPYAFYDPSTKLNELSALIYGGSGETQKKIKKKDFLDISAVDGGTLYGDSRIKFFNYTPISYPYTVDFSYSYTTSNTAFLPRWMPVDDYLVSTEKSLFKVQFAPQLKWRKKEKNFNGYPITNLSKGNLLHYEMVGLPAQKSEMLSPSFHDFEPELLLALNEFHLEGVNGKATDWKSMGKWQYERLLKGRGELPQNTVDQISGQLEGITDRVEKIKGIYRFVQDNTRYISVQLGIGGWQPISAKDVDEVKYGDCKGLTNYTMALLKSQGIDAYYSVVYAGNTKRGMEKDFACMQGNHVILNIPNGTEDIWLECTSQKIPFGFLSDFTDDRDVLVVTPEGGKIKRTQAYVNEDNLQRTKAIMRISPAGELQGEVAIVTKAIQYDDHVQLENLSKEKRMDHYKAYWKNINGLEILETKFQNVKDQVEFNELVSVKSDLYAEKINGELLFKPNAFNVSNFVPERYRNRQTALEIPRGYTDEDEFIIKLPSGYDINTLPEAITIDDKYGSYSMKIEKSNENELRYTRKLNILKGNYPKEDYAGYRTFRRKIRKADNIKIVINQS